MGLGGCKCKWGVGCGYFFEGFLKVEVKLFDRRVIVVFDKEGVDFECDFD